MKLGKIAEIKTGLVLTRKKAKIIYEIEEEYRLITLKNIEYDGVFNEEPFEIFQSNDVLDNQYFTQEGDILIRLTHPNTVVYINKEQSNLLVPSYFAIIKLKTNDFIPQYITWYLNSEKVKKELIRSQTGTVISSTNKSVLSSIDIVEMSLDEQKKIADIQELYWREKYLLGRLMEEKEKYYKALTTKLIERRK